MTNKTSKDQIKLLISNRTSVTSQLSRLTDYITENSQQLSYYDVLSRSEKVSLFWDSFSNIQTELEHLDSKTNHSNEREDFENAYFYIDGICKQLIAEKSPNINSSNLSLNPAISQQTLGQPNSHNSCLELPKIPLPSFYGSYDKWLQFSESFKAIVHDNSNISKIQKFWYLRGCLKGDAEGVIAALEVSETNYDKAWKLLCDRYENKKMIIHKHIKTIMDIPISTQESQASLRSLIDITTQHLRSLESLKLPVDQWDTLIIYILSSKLDQVTAREWEEFSITLNTHTPTIDQFLSFLNKRCMLLENINKSKNQIPKNPNSHIRPKHMSASGTHVSLSATSHCLYCKKGHLLFQCQNFLKLNDWERVNQIRNLKACTNCLRKGHTNKNCISTYRCKKCNEKHNTILHIDRKQNNTNTSNNTSSSSSHQQSDDSDQLDIKETHNNMCFIDSVTQILTNEPYVLLSTANVLVYDKNGEGHICRALLDNCSQSNFLTKSFFEKLNFPSTVVNHSVQGFGSKTTTIFSKTTATFASTVSSFTKKDVVFLITDQITKNLPTISFKLSQLKIPKDILLADAQFNQSSSIDMLIGNSLFWTLICEGQIVLANNHTILQKTQLGWIVSGPIPMCNFSQSHCNLSISNQDIYEQIERFWKIEEFSENKINFSPEELECEEYFSQTIHRDDTGKFIVSLPLKDNINELGDSLNIAIKRFYSVERQLSNNPDLKTRYCQFMSEYENLGHMKKLDSLQIKTSKPVYYLPHHGVIKEDSSTTKLRVVFDGSCKTTSGISLNDSLKVGPKLQDDLIDLVTRFRTYQFVFTADVEKMYRMVKLQESQCDLQRIVWRTDPSQELDHYQLLTVTYGLSSSSYLAIKALQQAAIENRDKFPEACQAIISNFYVDDFLCGSNSIENSKKLICDIIQVLDSSGFKLRKWVSNCNEILQGISDIDLSKSTFKFISDEKTTKTLGLTWNSQNDIFQFAVSLKFPKKTSKRTILSSIGQIFDPLGLLGPSTLIVKLIMQELWKQGIDWDDDIPDNIQIKWLRFLQEIPILNDIKIPRRIICSDPVYIELHCFSDSSQQAYGACCYLRSIDSLGKVHLNLISAKSRIAPLKTQTLPRLELSGSLLAVRLTQKIKNTIKIKIDDIKYWTDSTIVISWISTEPHKLNTFVANRVSEIQQYTKLSDWNHVSSENNPADIISRGMYPTDLLNCEIWWTGPAFLTQNKQFWPQNNTSIIIPEPLELKNISQTFTSQTISIDFIQKFSTLTELQRVIAICSRFLNFKRNPLFLGPLIHAEFNKAIVSVCFSVQQHHFSKEYLMLKNNKKLPFNSKILSLDPFLDKDNLIRVGGRLKNANLNYEQKHPILLPSNSHLTKLIILHEHERNLHSGAQATLSFIRSRFWPINGRSSVRKVLRRCIVCFRHNPVCETYKMGNLPKSRLIPQRPFSIVGIDFAGPFHMKDGKTRNRKIVKGYLCVFVCFLSKACHLELVSDMSSESFLNCLKRFVSRRGICSEIYTDNGTNFVGAKNEIKNILSEISSDLQFTDFLSTNQILWHFLPPTGPNFGGLHEACVKSAKFHLKRILGNSNLTFESLITVFCQVEAVLNSRPLVSLSNDPNDFNCLTPSHFLIGEQLNAIPQTDVREIAENRLSHYKLLQQYLQHFWDRWTHEYLSTLQERAKWNKCYPNIEIGQLVIIKEENTAPLFWKMGRIIEIFPGSDNIVRVVSIKTANGIVKRPVTKVCILPIDTTEDK